MARGSIRIGTSGWVYKHWMEIFYPKKMPGDRQLEFYAQRFDTVEINYSFYRLPERRTFEGWSSRTPQSFLFAVKASRYLTHIKKLAEPQEPLARLMDRAQGLGEKLGPVLFQFSPYWKADLERLSEFMGALKQYEPQRFAFEFRHRSWATDDVYSLLHRNNAALVLAVRAKTPIDVRLTADWSYIRMHEGSAGGKFTAAELKPWGARLRSWSEDQIDAYVYFNNDWEGYALQDAKRLRKLVEEGG